MNDRIKLAGVICMIVLLLYVLSFQSCSDNDDDDGPSPTPTPTPTIITFMKTYGGEKPDGGYSVQQTRDKGYIICGLTKSYGAGSVDICLLKTDEWGNQVWLKALGHDYSYAVRQTEDEGYILTGSSNSRVILIKTDRDGNEMWSRIYDKSYGCGYSVQILPDEGYVLTGLMDMDVFISRTDESGNVLWTRTYGVQYAEDTAYSIQHTRDNGFVVCGQWNYHYPVGEGEVFILKTDEMGFEQWFNILVPGGYHWAWDVKQATDDGYVVVAHTMGYGELLIKTDEYGNKLWQKGYGSAPHSIQLVGNDGYIIGSSGASLVRTDLQGNVLWERYYTIGIYTYSVNTTSDGGFIVCGQTGDTEGDIFLIKTDPDGNVYENCHTST
ncbi:hypothetical protein JXQ70_10275 [bacterium]|nr:hypothetical protein [bacterium]